MLSPKNTKYKKQFKGKLNKTKKKDIITYGKYAIKAVEEIRLTSKQIESARKVIVRKMKKLGFLWIRVFPDTPVTAKPTENRMGKGKGTVSFWVAKIKRGQILYEISDISIENAKKVLKAGANKLPVKTRFIYR
uniref:Ribosomal protein L16 n=1 Tax=Plasmopara viticola TaxID=143451 RepID=A0A6C0N9Z4_PLAVT|nr:ribosomal protein L16 [Plasmopara viticola]QHW07491.1 ribosomal protein L16 [Plasmopara viticola]